MEAVSPGLLTLDYYTVRHTEQCGLCFVLDKSGSLCTVSRWVSTALFDRRTGITSGG